MIYIYISISILINNNYSDKESEPFRVENNEKCLASDQWNQWLSNYASATNNTAIRTEYGWFVF